MITKENIEAFLLDFLEGNLNESQLIALENFLSEHPEYKADFEIFQIEKEEDVSFNKDFLKKAAVFEPVIFQDIQEGTTHEKMLIAASENQLSEKETIHFNNHLAGNLSAQKEFALYQKTMLTADNTIVFPNANQLKRKEGKAIDFSTWLKWSAAASVVGFGFWMYFGTNSVLKINGVAQQLPKLHKETKTQQAKEPIKKMNENVADFNLQKVNQQHLSILPFLQPKDSLVIPQKFAPTPIEVANVEQKLDTNQSNGNAIKNENLPVEELAQISPAKEKTLTPLEFVNAKVKKRLFGKEDPTQEEMYASISNKISSAAGVSFSFFRKREKGHRSFHLRIGKFSIEKN